MMSKRQIANWILDRLGDKSNFEDCLCPLCAYQSVNCVDKGLECVEGIAEALRNAEKERYGK